MIYIQDDVETIRTKFDEEMNVKIIKALTLDRPQMSFGRQKYFNTLFSMLYLVTNTYYLTIYVYLAHKIMLIL